MRNLNKNQPVAAGAGIPAVLPKIVFLTLLIVTLAVSTTARGEDYPSGQAPLLTVNQLEELVGPIALYPDEVLGIILPAATYPLQVVQAARYLERRERNPALQPDPDWDDSVVALLNYPEVVRILDADLDWTWRLGSAFINQQASVMDAIQHFRNRVFAAGNLQSNSRQVINRDNGNIIIRTADPEVIYLPRYEPAQVVIVRQRPVIRYYPVAYPVYYYPYPRDYDFRVSFFWGVTTAFLLDWNRHHLYAHHHRHHRHPYYRATYYRHYYQPHRYDRDHDYDRYRYRDRTPVWRPGRHSGVRPVISVNINNIEHRHAQTRARQRDQRRHRSLQRHQERPGVQIRQRPVRQHRAQDEPRRQRQVIRAGRDGGGHQGTADRRDDRRRENHHVTTIRQQRHDVHTVITNRQQHRRETANRSNRGNARAQIQARRDGGNRMDVRSMGRQDRNIQRAAPPALHRRASQQSADHDNGRRRGANQAHDNSNSRGYKNYVKGKRWGNERFYARNR